jgi:Sec-independent protein translocase protein TatA
MILKPLRKMIVQTKKEMSTLNDEYENMVKSNRLKSKEIRNSIQKKSNEFNKRKADRSSHFNFIRNK